MCSSKYNFLFCWKGDLIYPDTMQKSREGSDMGQFKLKIHRRQGSNSVKETIDRQKHIGTHTQKKTSKTTLMAMSKTMRG